ncbi:hypothetical protein ACIBCO_40610 [Streptomyces violascens]|uniref:hypothetical protein n=1 Tax=Streptomyces violascens TaxID=67381 RepID=UPI003795DA9D
MRALRLLLVVLAVLVSMGCVAVAPKTVAPARELVPTGGRVATVAPGPSSWPDPVQPPARETLAPDYGPALTTPTAPSAEPVDPDRPPPEAHSGRHEHAPHAAVHPPAAVQPPSPVPRPHRHRPRPGYDPVVLCSWAQNTGVDPSVVAACRQQLGR